MSDGVPSVVSLGPTPPPSRRRRYVVVGAVTLAVMLVAGVAALPLLVGGEGRREAMRAGLGTVRTYAGLSVEHTDADVDYPMTPPAGGAHDPVWLECGVYDVPVRDENAVHDLEHGAVWISYDPGLGGADVRRLARLLPQNGIMAPYPGLPARSSSRSGAASCASRARTTSASRGSSPTSATARRRLNRARRARAGHATPREATAPRAPRCEARRPGPGFPGPSQFSDSM